MPLLAVDDVRAAVEYYEQRLLFAREFVYPSTEPVFATIGYEGARLMLEAATGFAAKYGMEAAVWPRGRGVDLNVRLDGDIDAYYERVTAAGAAVARPVFTTEYGMRQFTVRDLDGYLLTFIRQE
ncbi:VOC family protein [Anaeroselena agilis]|uniref:VOC family protein n=1 Tax=Anaeroselena agilis TaxID=3063788 RepID=A0ABU3P2E3_9FIRM|nr:VOC family protein [Selenomonadales bacterium 4137-cl]